MFTDCGVLTISDGIVNATSGTTFGQSATVICNQGYDLNGNGTVTCRSGGWMDIPTCDIQGLKVLNTDYGAERYILMTVVCYI